MKEYPNQKFLNECFDYDKNTGLLYWKKNRPLTHFLNSSTCTKWHTENAGNHAGRTIKENDTLSYRSVKLQGKSYYVHIIIWIMNYGYRPKLIDHLDGDGLNNKLSNLRESTNKNNSRKSKISTRNKSGRKGVRLSPSNKWMVSLNYNKKSLYLGTYDDLDYASKIYSTAVFIISGENFTGISGFNRGSNEYNKILNIINSKK